MNKIRTQQYNYHYILGLASQATFLAFISVTSLGCVHQPQKDIVQEDWVHQVTNYHNSFALDSTYKDILNINQPMRDTVRAKFSKQVKHRAAHSIAKWLIQEDGHGMKYDLSANLTPVEAYQQQRANCLSFTLLLASLAKELDINIQFNSVDIPDTWNLDSDNGLVYYRHINAVLKTPEKTHIYDLAMELYDPGYPQHQITEQQAIAQLYNNLAVDSLGKGELKKAQHLIKTAITLSPENPDLWVNFGVILKRDKQLNMAEKSFKHTYKIDPRSTAAANNLELFYNDNQHITTLDHLNLGSKLFL